MARFLPNLVPPFRFSMVENEIYRGAYPSLMNFRFLTRLKLKMIISLVPDEPTQDLKGFCAFHDIKSVFTPTPKFKEEPVLKAKDIGQILSLLVDPSNFPVYIHCLDGANTTGMIIACLRKLQLWNLPHIMSEFRRFPRDYDINGYENAYLENLPRIAVQLPREIPEFLWKKKVLTQHPFFELRASSTTDGQSGEGSDHDREMRRRKSELRLRLKRSMMVQDLKAPRSREGTHYAALYGTRLGYEMDFSQQFEDLDDQSEATVDSLCLEGVAETRTAEALLHQRRKPRL